MRQGRGDMHDQETRSGPTTTRSVQQMLGRYPISIDGEHRAVTPHDLRRDLSRHPRRHRLITAALRAPRPRGVGGVLTSSSRLFGLRDFPSIDYLFHFIFLGEWFAAVPCTLLQTCF